MIVVRIFGWIIALCLSLAAGLSSFAISNQVKAPNLTAAVGFFPDAAASGDLALFSYAARRADDPDAKISDFEMQLVRHAYRGEPLSAVAVGLFAMASADRGRSGDADKLLELAGKLTRRSSFVSSEAIKIAAKRNDPAEFFLWLSRVMLTNPGARKVYGAAMADATSRDGAVAALAPILGSNPGWANYYWRLVVARPRSLVNAAILRSEIAGAPWRQTELLPTDQRLTMGLVRAGELDAAYRLARSLGFASKNADIGLNRLTDGDFSKNPVLPPFDWQLSALGNLGASIDAADKRLAISAIAGARGAAAEQLVRLSPGNYTVGWSLSGESVINPGMVTVLITCAERGGGAAEPVRVALVEGRRRSIVNIKNDDCVWHRFSIDVAIPDDSLGVDVELRDLSMSLVEA